MLHTLPLVLTARRKQFPRLSEDNCRDFPILHTPLHSLSHPIKLSKHACTCEYLTVTQRLDSAGARGRMCACVPGHVTAGSILTPTNGLVIRYRRQNRGQFRMKHVCGKLVLSMRFQKTGQLCSCFGCGIVRSIVRRPTFSCCLLCPVSPSTFSLISFRGDDLFFLRFHDRIGRLYKYMVSINAHIQRCAPNWLHLFTHLK